MVSDDNQINEPVRYNGAIYIKIATIDVATALLKNYIDGTHIQAPMSILEPLVKSKSDYAVPIESLTIDYRYLIDKRL